ncbi:MAG: acetyltransferase [Acidobacteria bacterium]|nr:acetyltransferase [Acidobacteriota bacterium]
MNLPVIVLGGGGHAKVLIATLSGQRRELLGFTDPDEKRTDVMGVCRMGGDEIIFQYHPDNVRLVNGLGSIGSTDARRELYERYRHRAYVFETVVHPASIIASGVTLDNGVQIMAAAVVQPGCRIGANSVLNTGASVDHDCVVGPHVNIAPGAVLSGGIQIGAGVHIGTGASIIQGVVIGANSVIGAGAVVVRDVPPDVTVIGVPARIIRRHATV